MIEQLISTQGVQTSQLTEALKQQPIEANSTDVMRFNTALTDNLKIDAPSQMPASDLLVDIKVDGVRVDSDVVVDRAEKSALNPLAEMDASYKSIMQQMNNTPKFDQFLDISQKETTPTIRSNVSLDAKEVNSEQDVKTMLSETRELYQTAREYSNDISKWHLKTQVWSANIKILTTVVSQASQGFKTLFRSSG